MKKCISLLCVLALVIGAVAFSAVSASADDFEKGSTAVDVKTGDEVTYALYLDKVEQPIIGGDFSVYYDPGVFELQSVADFNNNTKESEWEAVINPNLTGQVKGVWSILKGVDFSSKRNFVTLNLKAIAGADNTHITYRIRYLYDNDVFNSEDYPQISDYEFTCSVTVNGDEVLKDAPPELNVDEPEENGKFANSLDGKGEHADANLPGVVDKAKEKKAANNSGGGSGADDAKVLDGSSSGGGANVSGGGSGGSADKKDNGSDAAKAPLATTAEGYFITATDADGNITATSDEAPAVTTTGDNQGKGGSPILWIIIVLVVIAGGGAAVYFFMKKPKNPDGTTPEAASAPEEKEDAVSEAAAEDAPEAKEDTAPEAEEEKAPEAEAAPEAEEPAAEADSAEEAADEASEEEAD